MAARCGCRCIQHNFHAPPVHAIVQGAVDLKGGNLMPFDLSSKLDFLTSPHFWTGVAVAVGVAFLNQTRDAAWSLFQRAWMTRRQFDLSGYWAGTCTLPSYTSPSLELWRYSRSGDRVKLAFYSYSSAQPSPEKWIGGGVFRGNKLSAYYYLNHADSPESGTVTLEMKGLRLKGVYAQFDPQMPNDPLYVSKKGTYEQKRVTLTRRQRARIFFGFPPVAKYQQAAELWCSEPSAVQSTGA
jgi:hypothetical protein